MYNGQIHPYIAYHSKFFILCVILTHTYTHTTYYIAYDWHAILTLTYTHTIYHKTDMLM